ncbi:MAG: rhodanese-like domain-containing protein [Planctomycetota bacterium]
MQVIKQTLREMVVVGVTGLAAAFVLNAVREKGHISPTKNYFAVGATLVPPLQDSGKSPASAAKAAPQPAADATQPVGQRQSSAKPSESKVADKKPALGPQHPYQEMDFEQVADAFKDRATLQGLNVFVDARDDTHFAEGHIPGAVQCYPYEVQRYLDEVLTRANGAEKVIVYCNGGDCEDSIFACRELIEAGIPSEAVYLYPGGWEEWTEKKMPAAAGRGTP